MKKGRKIKRKKNSRRKKKTRLPYSILRTVDFYLILVKYVEEKERRMVKWSNKHCQPEIERNVQHTAYSVLQAVHISNALLAGNPPVS